MTLHELQNWVSTNFDERLSKLSLDYGVARLLTQSGQLGEAVLHKGDVTKEVSDVLFVLAAIANRAGVNLEEALQKSVAAKSPEAFFSSLGKR